MAKSKSDGMSHPGLGDCYPEKLGDEDNLQDTGYDNDVASDWRRGMPGESAEGKPGFDSTSKRLRGGNKDMS